MQHECRGWVCPKRKGALLISKIVLLLLAGIFLLPGCDSLSAAEMVTVTGVVNEDLQIETADGTIYEILESEKGVEVFELKGKTVRVTGEVEEVDGDRLIQIVSYETVRKP